MLSFKGNLQWDIRCGKQKGSSTIKCAVRKCKPNIAGGIEMFLRRLIESKVLKDDVEAVGLCQQLDCVGFNG